MNFNSLSLCTLFSTLLISGCVWVELSPQGSNIDIASADRVGHCKKVGHVTAKTRNSIAAGSRSQKKVANELSILARNEAVRLQANTIVADSLPEKGEQKFSAYRCVR